MSDATLIPKRLAAVTPSDTVKLQASGMLGLYVGGAGNVVAVGENTADAGTAVTFICSAGQVLVGSFKLVKAASTATGIVALYRQ